MIFRTVNLSDSQAIADIYNPFVTDSTVTFEEKAVTAEQISQRIEKVLDSGFPWIVLEQDGEILGYAYAGPWHTRSAYRFTAESTIYLSPYAGGKGYGHKLYRELLARLKEQGIKNVMGVVALPNPPSVKLHQSLGFTKVGEFKNIGVKFERQISVSYWQLKLGA